MGRGALAFAATVALLCALSGCAGAPEVFEPLLPSPQLTAQDYEELLARWTRRVEVYDRLDTVFFAHATFHAPAFRRAFMLRHLNVYGPGSEEAGRLTLTRPEAEESLEFFFSVSMPSDRWNDFDRPGSIWRVTLVSDTGEPVDAKVERVKVNANLRVIYPYISDFARTYSLRFPLHTASGAPVIGEATRQLTLRIQSALGVGTMVWKISRTAPPQAPRP
jgi:hypothetical protein